jgi:thymidine kinase
MLQHTPVNSGWIEVITGSMFSGKTEELIRRMRRAEIAKQKIVLFKPAIDERYSTDFVVSHDKRVIEAVSVEDAKQIEILSKSYDVIGIDEAQFFGQELVDVCERLADMGKRVIVSGLDQDFQGKPFEPIPQLVGHRRIHYQELSDLHGLRKPSQPKSTYHFGSKPRGHWW